MKVRFSEHIHLNQRLIINKLYCHRLFWRYYRGIMTIYKFFINETSRGYGNQLDFNFYAMWMKIYFKWDNNTTRSFKKLNTIWWRGNICQSDSIFLCFGSKVTSRKYIIASTFQCASNVSKFMSVWYLRYHG